MRNKDYHLYLTDKEYSRIILALINLKNDLIAQGKYTDGVDDVLRKITSARKKENESILYIRRSPPTLCKWTFVMYNENWEFLLCYNVSRQTNFTQY